MVTDRIRVLCVDDHPLVREGISLKITGQADMDMVGAAASGEEGLRLFHQHHPHVTLMDLQLPTMSGLEAIHAIRASDPAARIVVLTMFQGDEDIHRALKAGATTYLPKSILSDELVRTVRAVFQGAHPIPPEIASRLADRAVHPSLTPRESAVVGQIAQGARNKEIADRLGISEDTVEAHIKNIFVKLEVRDRTAAVTVALRRGIIHVV
ncbi:MAG: response regulator [Vicinamibacterales bacterium]